MNQTLRSELNALRLPDLALWAPGPHALSPAVRRVLTEYQARFSHRSTEFKDSYSRAIRLIRTTFHLPDNHTPLIFGHTGSYNWEMVAVNTPADWRTLGMELGAFSGKWPKLFQARGRDVEVVRADWGDGIEPGRWRTKLSEGWDLILITHNETSTGVALPLAQMCDAVREHSPDTLIAVDAVSIAGATDLRTDQVRPDYYLWSLQKDFSIPAIGSVMIVSDRASEVAKGVPNRGYVLDLVEWMAKAADAQTPMTVPDLTIECLIARLEEMRLEGDARFVRHAKLSGMQRDWAAKHGLRVMAAPGYESPTVTAVCLPKGISGPEVVTAVRRFLNVQIAAGYGPTRDRAVRIAAMGQTSTDDMGKALRGLSLILENWEEVREARADEGSSACGCPSSAPIG